VQAVSFVVVADCGAGCDVSVGRASDGDLTPIAYVRRLCAMWDIRFLTWHNEYG